MACFHPLKAFYIGENKMTGKSINVITGKDDAFIVHNGKTYYDFKYIPCGKCIGCRLDYSRTWANRMIMELDYHEDAWFITLTYNNDYVPHNPVYDKDTGEYLYDSQSLRKKHVQTFFKHLRKHFPDCKIRFFCAGEYGSNTLRPHYHAIVYGLHLDDLVLYKKTPLGDSLYNSKNVSECWSNFVGFRSDGSAIYDSIGYVVIAPVTWETCAYVARYVTKKMSGPLEDWFSSQNMESPFCLMSRRPGIGAQYFYDHSDCLDYDFINIKTEKKGIKFVPPKYFDRLYEKENGEAFGWLRSKERGAFAQDRLDSVLNSIDVPYDQYLADCEMNLKKRIQTLDRTDI